MKIKRYRPTGLHFFEEEDGPVVTYSDHEQAITAAVEAERERVWNIIEREVQYEIDRGRPNSPYRFEAEVIKRLIFPDGDPKQQPTTPAQDGGKNEQNELD